MRSSPLLDQLNLGEAAMASFDDGLGENWYEFEFKLYIFVKLVV
jgi:hypothetical protein